MSGGVGWWNYQLITFPPTHWPTEWPNKALYTKAPGSQSQQECKFYFLLHYNLINWDGSLLLLLFKQNWNPPLLSSAVTARYCLSHLSVSTDFHPGRPDILWSSQTPGPRNTARNTPRGPWLRCPHSGTGRSSRSRNHREFYGEKLFWCWLSCKRFLNSNEHIL